LFLEAKRKNCLSWGKPNLPSAEYNAELAEMKSALHAP